MVQGTYLDDKGNMEKINTIRPGKDLSDAPIWACVVCGIIGGVILGVVLILILR